MGSCRLQAAERGEARAGSLYISIESILSQEEQGPLLIGQVCSHSEHGLYLQERSEDQLTRTPTRRDPRLWAQHRKCEALSGFRARSASSPPIHRRTDKMPAAVVRRSARATSITSRYRPSANDMPSDLQDLIHMAATSAVSKSSHPFEAVSICSACLYKARAGRPT